MQLVVVGVALHGLGLQRGRLPAGLLLLTAADVLFAAQTFLLTALIFLLPALIFLLAALLLLLTPLLGGLGLSLRIAGLVLTRLIVVVGIGGRGDRGG